MKTLSTLAAALILTIGSTQLAHASECDYADFYWGVMMLSVTSAPTGTTFALTDNCRQAALILKEDAIKYRMTGEASAYLKESVQKGQQTNPTFSEEQIIEKFINIQTL